MKVKSTVGNTHKVESEIYCTVKEQFTLKYTKVPIILDGISRYWAHFKSNSVVSVISNILQRSVSQ